MGLLEFFWDVSQQRQIDSAASGVQRAETGVRSQESSIAALEARIDRLTLVTRAMSELLVQHAQLTDAELLAKVEEIDLRDGKRHGRLNAGAQKCAKCGRVSAARREACLYCGAPLGPPNPFAGA
jgi:hypothetical protein